MYKICSTRQREKTYKKRLNNFEEEFDQFLDLVQEEHVAYQLNEINKIDGIPLGRPYFGKNVGASIVYDIEKIVYEGSYTGQFLNGKRDGLGYFLTANKKLMLKGMWKNDFPIGKMEITKYPFLKMVATFEHKTPNGPFIALIPYFCFTLKGNLFTVGNRMYHDFFGKTKVMKYEVGVKGFTQYPQNQVITDISIFRKEKLLVIRDKMISSRGSFLQKLETSLSYSYSKIKRRETLIVQWPLLGYNSGKSQDSKKILTFLKKNQKANSQNNVGIKEKLQNLKDKLEIYYEGIKEFLEQNAEMISSEIRIGTYIDNTENPKGEKKPFGTFFVEQRNMLVGIAYYDEKGQENKDAFISFDSPFFI